MIIECKNCHKKFAVRNSDIPVKGRIVQCGHCSTQWLQMPITSSLKTKDFNVDVADQETSKDEFKASDGKNYKFLGSQWAEVLPSGKFGSLARKKISAELDKLSSRRPIKKSKIIKKSNQPADLYQETEDGMGLFSIFIVLVITFAAIILVLDTFKNQLIPFFPSLDNYLVYIFETLNNIYIIIKDLFISYK